MTVNADGSPHVAIVWVGLEDDEIVSGHLSDAHSAAAKFRTDLYNGTAEYDCLRPSSRVQGRDGFEVWIESGQVAVE